MVDENVIEVDGASLVKMQSGTILPGNTVSLNASTGLNVNNGTGHGARHNTQELKCSTCSACGTLRPFGKKFVVRCYRHGEICCQTNPKETELLAIEQWEEMQR